MIRQMCFCFLNAYLFLGGGAGGRVALGSSHVSPPCQGSLKDSTSGKGDLSIEISLPQGVRLFIMDKRQKGVHPPTVRLGPGDEQNLLFLNMKIPLSQGLSELVTGKDHAISIHLDTLESGTEEEPSPLETYGNISSWAVHIEMDSTQYKNIKISTKAPLTLLGEVSEKMVCDDGWGVGALEGLFSRRSNWNELTGARERPLDEPLGVYEIHSENADLHVSHMSFFKKNLSLVVQSGLASLKYVVAPSLSLVSLNSNIRVERSAFSNSLYMKSKGQLTVLDTKTGDLIISQNSGTTHLERVSYNQFIMGNESNWQFTQVP